MYSFHKILLILGIVVSPILLYGYFYEQNNIVLENVDIKIDNLPYEFEGLILLQFSDLHFQKVGTREKRLREIINKINPDIIFFTGDLFNSKRDIRNSQLVEEAIDFLSSLHFKKNCFVVWGEEEYYFREYLKKILSKINLSVLDDKVISIEISKFRLNIIGITEDLETLDIYYDKRYKENVKRFINFKKLKLLEGYRDYYFYVGGQYSGKLKNYEVSGRLKIPANIDNFGIAFYSQFPMGIFRSYFLQLDPEQRVFYLTSSNKESKFQGNTFSRVGVENGKWFSFKIDTRTLPGKTVIKAKIWEDTQDEPEFWEIDCVDYGKNRIPKGAVGVQILSEVKDKYLGNIRLKMLNYNINNKELYEGVTEIPLDDEFHEIISEDSGWMTLGDIEKFIFLKQKEDKPYILEKKVNRLIKNRNRAGFTILLSHRPNVITVAEGKGIDLILSGHTQGGQVNLPLLEKFIFDEYKGQKLDSGLKKFSDTTLYINRGIGTSIIPFRFRSLPEITLFRLSSNQ